MWSLIYVSSLVSTNLRAKWKTHYIPGKHSWQAFLASIPGKMFGANVRKRHSWRILIKFSRNRPTMKMMFIIDDEDWPIVRKSKQPETRGGCHPCRWQFEKNPKSRVEHGSGEEATEVNVLSHGGGLRVHAGVHRPWKLRRSRARHKVERELHVAHILLPF